MSITSSNNQDLHPDFADLLARHTSLVDWLSNALSSREELRAEDLLPRFLAECAEQGIPETAYPFSASDRGLADLQIYLQNAWEEIDAFHVSPSDPGHVEREDARTQLEDNALRETAADKIPVVDLTSSDELVAESEKKNTETVPARGEEDVEQLVNTPTPIVTAAENSEKEPTDQDAEPPIDAEAGAVGGTQEDVTQLVTEHMAATTPTVDKVEADPQSAQEEPQHPQNEVLSANTGPSAGDGTVVRGEEDVTQLVTEHMAATTPVVSEGVTAEEEQEQTAQVAPLGPRNPAASRRKRSRRPRTRRQRILAWILLIAVLATVLIPAIALVNFGISAYNTYHELSNQAHSAVTHLLDVKNEFSSGSGTKSRLSAWLDPTRLQRVQQDFIASGHDFQQLQTQLKQSSTLHTVTAYFPQYRETLASAQAASQIGLDVTAIGQIATEHATQIAPSFSGSLLAPTGKPLVTQALLDTLNTTIDQITPLLKDIEVQAPGISLDSLPISASEKTQLGQLLQLLPQAITDLGITRSLLGEAGWLLGVNQPRTFLVQTMDRAELRGTGGFTGQYGELTVNGGRVAPFSLKDISLVEYTNSSVTQGQLAPQQYRSWWPFANWGLRDSNVSADFPTTAQLAITLYKQETGDSVDGVISFTPVVIEHILAIIGPIQVPGYGSTVTAQNLEDMLHYYQLDNRGILKQILSQPNNTSTSQRKRFTNYLSTLVMDKVRSASPDQLLAIAHQVLADLKSKDLQMYFTDPATENVLMHYGYAGVLDRSATHDGFYVVQQNLSASKASQYVQTILHDTVTLDSRGGATHTLQIRLVYNQAGPVYGYDTYYDYLRVYVPTSSQLLSGDGFSSGTPLCGGAYGNCAVDGPYPGGEMVCPSGQYQPGASPPTLTEPDGGTWEPLQTLSGPTNTSSDEPGRAMYGGWVIVPKNCTMNVTLSWYVPPMSAQPYSLLVQRQAGTFPELDLTILPDAADCAKLETRGLHYDQTLTQDTSFSLPAYHTSTRIQSQQSCYPRPSV